MNLRWLRHLYVTPLIGTVYRHRDDLKQGPIRLRGPDDWDKDGPYKEYPILTDKAWVNAKNMIGRIRAAVHQDIELNRVPLVLGSTGRGWIERLVENTTTPWAKSDTKGLLRFVVPLETNPNVTVYSGGGFAHMEVGSLWFVQPTVPHSMINMGTYAAVHLICEIETREGT